MDSFGGNSNNSDSSSQKRYKALVEMERERQKYAQSRGGRYAGPRFDSQQQCAAMERRHTRVRRLRRHSAGISKDVFIRALTFSLQPPPFFFVCHINHPPYNNRISNERALRVADIARARASDHRQVNRGSAMRLLYKSGLRRNR